jgi:predicted ATP-grasp superfamily ATP-dependent carboligase
MNDVLIIARSARALSASAYQAGFNVHVMDNFADQDTQAVSTSVYRLKYKTDGFDQQELLEQVSALVNRYPEIMVVTGSGFEASPQLLGRLSAIAPVMSNSESTIRCLKDPQGLHALLNNAFIKTPEILLKRPSETQGWLLKQVAGDGGGHVLWLSEAKSETGTGAYYQKFTEGKVLSAVFLALKTQAKIVGVNEQLQAVGFTDMPFLYQGAISLNKVDEQHLKQIDEIVNKITKQTGLIGLCGIDYILNESDQVIVLEVNPRPPASFELHEQGTPLFELHLACFQGRNVICPACKDAKFRAYAVYYARHGIQIPHEILWPVWVKDRPASGAVIAAKMPVCSVHAY